MQSFYSSAQADNSRWPWIDNHMIFNVLGGNNGYEVYSMKIIFVTHTCPEFHV